MAITTMAGILAAPVQRFPVAKTAVVVTAGAWGSHWLASTVPAAGSAPSSGLAGDVPTKATAGALANFVNPVSANTYLARTELAMSSSFPPGLLFLYDRLWHNSAIDATSTAAQTINSVALTRPDALGVGVEVWLETYTAMGAGTPTVTLSYTNAANTAGQSASSGALVTTMTSFRTVPFQLVAGDTGVRSIQSWTANATFTSGTIGLVMRRAVAALGIAYSRLDHDALALALPRIYDDACLELLFTSNLGAAPGVNGTLVLIQG